MQLKCAEQELEIAINEILRGAVANLHPARLKFTSVIQNLISFFCYQQRWTRSQINA